LNEKTPVPGMKIQMESEHIAREEGRLLVTQSRMKSGGKNLSISNETFEFDAKAGKAVLKLTQQGTYFEGSDGAQRRRVGHQQLFSYLRKHIDG
jgi:hypothetical protein